MRDIEVQTSEDLDLYLRDKYKEHYAGGFQKKLKWQWHPVVNYSDETNALVFSMFIMSFEVIKVFKNNKNIRFRDFKNLENYFIVMGQRLKSIAELLENVDDIDKSIIPNTVSSIKTIACIFTYIAKNITTDKTVKNLQKSAHITWSEVFLFFIDAGYRFWIN